MFQGEKSYSRIHWTNQEENIIKQLKQTNQIDSWKKIASILKKTFPQKNRSPKQCRERYTNYIKFNSGSQKVNEWNQKEDIYLFKFFMQYGPKWVKIANLIPGKSQNHLKNKFYGQLRKLIRKINKVWQRKLKRVRKNIKLETLVKLLHNAKNNTKQKYSSQQHELQAMCDNIRSKVIQIISTQQDTAQYESKIQQLSTIIQQNNQLVKYLNKKDRRGQKTQKKRKIQTNQCPSLKQTISTPQNRASEPNGDITDKPVPSEACVIKQQKVDINNEQQPKPKIIQNYIITECRDYAVNCEKSTQFQQFINPMFYAPNFFTFGFSY